MHRIHATNHSVFDAMVEELCLDEQDAKNILRPTVATAIDAIWQAAQPPAAPLISGAAKTPYSEAASEIERRDVDEVVTDEEHIRAELGLLPGLSAEQVSVLRRRFARHNHPDLFPPKLRPLATLRMTIANSLCDGYAG